MLAKQKDGHVRFYLFCIMIMLALSGCVNYAGMHANAKPLDSKSLSESYRTDLHQKSTLATTTGWWGVFKDPHLNQLIDIALSDSPTLQIAETRVLTATQMAGIAASKRWPTASAYGNLTREQITENTIYPPPFAGNLFNEGNVGLNFKYEFDWWGKNKQSWLAKLSEAHAAEADLAEARLVLTSAITSSYFQLQNDLAKLEYAKSIVHQRQTMLSILKTRAAHGVESDIPLNTARSTMQSAELITTRLEEDVEITRHQLAALIGKNPFTTDIHTEKFTPNTHHLSLPKNIPANLIARRPDIAATRWRVEAAAAQINVAKARFFPNINLAALLSLQSYYLGELFHSSSKDNYIGAAIDLPIFDAGERRATLATKFSEYDNAVYEYNQTIVTALREVADQVSILKSLAKQDAAQTDIVTATRHDYRLTLSRYQHGIVDYSNLLEREDALLQEQNKATQIKTQHLQAIVAMMKALGGNYLTAKG